MVELLWFFVPMVITFVVSSYCLVGGPSWRMPSLGHTRRMLAPSKPRPDYRLIWDLEEELGFEHLTMDRRPAPVWTDAPGQVIELRSDWYSAYRASVAKGYAMAQTDWKNLAMTPTDADLAALEARREAMVEQYREKARRREQALLSSVDQSLRVSGERGFL